MTATRLSGKRLRLEYLLRGNREAIDRAMPSTEPQRRDGLWQDTCFEAFLMVGDGPGYFEFNFALSHDWAAYSFAGRRVGMAELDIPQPEFAQPGGSCDLSVLLDLSGLQVLDHTQEWHIGLTAVLVDRGKTKAYWALAHSQGAPDFHDPACFTATLAAPPVA